MSKELEQRVGWRITKVIFIVVALAGAAFFASFIPEALSNCGWQHTQYLSRNDVPRGFFDAPAESLTDCENSDVYMKYLLVFGAYFTISVTLYFVVRKVFKYIILGSRQYHS